MNRILKKLAAQEYKRLITLVLIFTAALIISAILYTVAGKGSTAGMNHENIKNLTFKTILFKNIKKNIIYFVVIIFLTCIGQSRLINLLFGLVSVFYGLSVIYLIKAMQADKIYFLYSFTDYFILFPILFYFTYISSSISKYTKRTKNMETISHKFDIIISSYIKLSFLYLLITAVYCFGYSYYIIILNRLLVR